jgi:hypothetical protein
VQELLSLGRSRFAAMRILTRQNICTCGDQIGKRFSRSRPIDAGLCRSSRRNSYCAYAATRSEWGKSRHGANQRFAYRDDLSFLKQPPEAFPIFFIAEGIKVRSHGLVYIYAQRGIEVLGNSCHIAQAKVVRLHHDRDDGHRNAKLHAPLCLLVNQCPIPRPALRVLVGLCGVIERELDVVESY